MAYQLLTGPPYESNPPFWISVAPTFANSTAITATGDKIAIIGRYQNPARATKSIRRILIHWGTITKAGGSGMTLSLQNVDTANGPTVRPDETQDQTVAVANGDANFASNTWYRSGALSADRSITPGEHLAVVVEYDGSGRLGADSVTVRCLTTTGASVGQRSITTKIGGTFAAVANITPTVAFEHSDGTFGFLQECRPVKTINTHSYKQDTAGADEHALAFQVLAKCKTDSCWAAINTAANTANFDVVLYSGTTEMEVISVDAHAIRSAAATPQYHTFQFAAEHELLPGTQYYLSFRPNQITSNISVYSFDVDDAGHLGGHLGGSELNYSTRLNSGAWASPTTTRRLLAGFGVCSWDNGAGGSGLIVPIGSGGLVF